MEFSDFSMQHGDQLKKIIQEAKLQIVTLFELAGLSLNTVTSTSANAKQVGPLSERLVKTLLRHGASDLVYAAKPPIQFDYNAVIEKYLCNIFTYCTGSSYHVTGQYLKLYIKFDGLLHEFEDSHDDMARYAVDVFLTTLTTFDLAQLRETSSREYPDIVSYTAVIDSSRSKLGQIIRIKEAPETVDFIRAIDSLATSKLAFLVTSLYYNSKCE